jgi:hypothetical protein
MKIDDRQVPAVAIGVWKSVLQELPEPELAALGALRPELQGGFRPGRMPARELRTRMKALLDVCPGMPDWLCTGLAQGSLARSLICVLSEEALGTAADALADLHGRAAVAAAMLLDAREPVRALGFGLLEGLEAADAAGPSGPADAPDATVARQQAARARLREGLGPFLAHIEALREPVAAEPAGIPLPAPEPAGAVLAPRRPDRLRRDHVLALREERKRTRQLTRELRDAQAQAAAARTRADELTSRWREASSEATARAREVAELRGDFEDRVDAAVQAQLDARLRPWLAPAESLRRDVTSLVGADLLAQAEALLAQQAEIDARHGLISRLRAERERSAAMLERLREAQADALQPLPALATMAARLADHHRALARRLGDEAAANRPAGTLLERLGGALATATSLDAIACVRNGMHEAAAIGLIEPAETEQAYALIHEAASRVYDRHRLAPGGAPSADSLRGVPLYALQAALARGQACALVVDGHNVLHALPMVFRPLFEAGVPGPRARRALEERLSVLVERHPSLRIQLWFDGPVVDERAVSARLRVRLSGGVGPDRADQAIAAYLRHLRAADPGELRAVVTADAAVAASARANEALVLEPDELQVWSR